MSWIVLLRRTDIGPVPWERFRQFQSKAVAERIAQRMAHGRVETKIREK